MSAAHHIPNGKCVQDNIHRIAEGYNFVTHDCVLVRGEQLKKKKLKQTANAHDLQRATTTKSARTLTKYGTAWRKSTKQSWPAKAVIKNQRNSFEWNAIMRTE